MSDSAFVDTNVLVYAVEADDGSSAKGRTARNLVRMEGIWISTQVLGEFFSAVTSSRRASPLTPQEAIAWVQFWKRLNVSELTTPHVDLALELVLQYRISYYDALIVATASLAGCAVVYSEDLSHGQTYGDVRVQNPFRES
ncbi:MAG: PIN domain-containing protein [Acidobacteriota bacterium]|jgi:predicted nucleic acid-binding protein